MIKSTARINSQTSEYMEQFHLVVSIVSLMLFTFIIFTRWVAGSTERGFAVVEAAEMILSGIFACQCIITVIYHLSR